VVNGPHIKGIIWFLLLRKSIFLAKLRVRFVRNVAAEDSIGSVTDEGWHLSLNVDDICKIGELLKEDLLVFLLKELTIFKIYKEIKEPIWVDVL